MESALYDETDGFYEHDAAGRRSGSFITSPEVGPLFGEVLARALDRSWDDFGRPDPFVVVDAGAGPGTLARSLRSADVECRRAMRLVLVERSAAQRARQPADLERCADLPGRAHVIVANELLDNLPFDIIECEGGGWRALDVGLDNGRFVYQAGDAMASVTIDAAPDGTRRPWPRRASEWVTDARAVASRVIAFDYFVRAADIGPSWLRTYRGHERGHDPLHDPGRWDITADVLLDALPAPDRLRDQAQFLRDHGLDELVEAGRRAWAAGAASPDLAAIKARSRVPEAEALTDANGLGGFVVAEWGGVS